MVDDGGTRDGCNRHGILHRDAAHDKEPGFRVGPDSYLAPDQCITFCLVLIRAGFANHFNQKRINGAWNIDVHY